MENLAGFLRARRGLVSPETVGLEPGGRRHVRGLRREELALLAGISVDYYVRLEQGRDRNPSAEVLDALARVLRLDDEAARHLHQLAKPAVRKRRPRPPARIRPSVALLVELSPWPAVLLDRSLTVLLANRLAGLLHPGFVAGRNLVRDAFLDPATSALHADPAAVRAECAAALRSVAGMYADDPGLQRLVGELSVHSEEFRRLWARAEVSYCRSGTKRFDHPLVGLLSLAYETLDVGDAGGQRLAIYCAAPGSPDGDKLTLLSGMSAPPTTPARDIPAGDATARHPGPVTSQPTPRHPATPPTRGTPGRADAMTRRTPPPSPSSQSQSQSSQSPSSQSSQSPSSQSSQSPSSQSSQSPSSQSQSQSSQSPSSPSSQSPSSQS